MSAASDPRIWGPPDRPFELVARNVSTRYLAIFIDGAIGLILLPFNVAHLGPSAYGLWALTASVTAYFGVLDLGYGGALVKFIAQYRTWRDRSALNEILSTVGVVFTGVGVVCFAVTGLLAWQFERLFNVAPEQVATAQRILLIIGAFLAIRFSVSIFGGVVYGFQRFYLNNVVSIGTSVVVASVNVAVLSAGYDLVTLVAALTAVRVLSLGFFAWNAFRVFPGLHVRPSLFRKSRLREVTGFSVYVLVLDWSAKLNYSADAIVIGAMLNTTAVAIWTVGQRLAQLTQQLTNQLNDALFPIVVDSDAAQQQERLQKILVQGTKLSLGLAAPLCLSLIILSDELVLAWVGQQFEQSILPTRILLGVVLMRVTTATANQILKGAGRHKLLAFTNATTAVVNVLLSVALIRPFGLPGVALGTILPVATAAAFVLYPAACRRVGLPVWRSVQLGIWPAAWPAAVMVPALLAAQRLEPTGLVAVAMHLAGGGAIYFALFIGLAIGTDERRFYWTKLREFIARRRHVPAAA